jgi:hypothetical protein
MEVPWRPRRPVAYDTVRLISQCDQWQGDPVAKGLVASGGAGAESGVAAGVEPVRAFTNASTSDVSKSSESCTIQASADVVAIGDGLGEAGDALGPRHVSGLALKLRCSRANLRRRHINVDSQCGEMHAEVIGGCSVSVPATALAVRALAGAVHWLQPARDHVRGCVCRGRLRTPSATFETYLIQANWNT